MEIPAVMEASKAQLLLQVMCSICGNQYNCPKQLDCFHVYCKSCLESRIYDGMAEEGQLTLQCPCCEKITKLPDTGVSGLQAAAVGEHLLEVQSRLTNFVEHSSVATATKLCSEHSRSLELFCDTCNTLICLNCTISCHNGHNYDRIEQAFIRFADKVSLIMKPVTEKLADVQNHTKKLISTTEEIRDQHQSITQKICTDITQLQEALEERKADLLHDADKFLKQKNDVLLTQKKFLSYHRNELENVVDYLQKMLVSRNLCDLLPTTDQMLDQAGSVARIAIQECPDMEILKVIKPNMAYFAPLSTIMKDCIEFGAVGLHKLCPLNTSASCKSFELATVGKTSTFSIQTRDSSGERVPVILQMLKCDFASEIKQTLCDYLIKEKCCGLYEVSYKPMVRGRHQLSITVYDHHIADSPFTILVMPSALKEIKIPFHSYTEVDRPWGIAVSQTGNIVVSEWNGNCISIYNPSGKKIKIFGGNGWENGEFCNPRGVALDDKGNIFVVDQNNHRVQKFSNEGVFLKIVGSRGNNSKEFSHPDGIAFNHTNKKIYIVDVSNHRIQIFDSNLNLCSMFGKEGTSKGQLKWPCSIAVDRSGKVYVTDHSSGQSRIQVFTAAGVYFNDFTAGIVHKHRLSYPSYICFDSCDRLYVSENSLGVVSVFSREGQFLHSFGSDGEKLKSPLGIFVDGSGAVYICDSENSRIQLY